MRSLASSDLALLYILREIGNLPVEERHAFLEHKCPAALRPDVERALAMSEQYPRFLEPERTQSFQPPSRVEKCEVRELLAQGSYGAVYKGWDRNLQRFVAIKFIHAPYSSNCFHEAQLLARFALTGIPEVYSTGVIDGVGPYVIMQFVDGPTILEAQKTFGLPLLHAVHLLADVAKVLDAAHRLGFIHLDLKPEHLRVVYDSITLDGGGYSVYILDWGIAAKQSDAPRSTAGTCLYSSPEQLAGEQVTVQADVYALGLVFLELVTGLSPSCFRDFIGRAIVETQRLHTPPFSSITHDLTHYTWLRALAVWIERVIASDLVKHGLARLAEDADVEPTEEVLRQLVISKQLGSDLRDNLDNLELRTPLTGNLHALLCTSLHPDPSCRYDVRCFGDGMTHIVEYFEYVTGTRLLQRKGPRLELRQ